MNVFILVVNYGTEDHLARFLRSVRAAVEEAPGTSVDVNVLENLEVDDRGLEAVRRRMDVGDAAVRVHSLGYNSGYFGGLGLAQALASPQTEALIYCNPDIVLDREFFVELVRAKDDGAGVLAPSIVTATVGDLNPLYVTRPTLAKLKRLQFTYSSTLTLACHDFLDRIRSILAGREAPSGHQPTELDIYAPHGALLIFTDLDFFRSLPRYEPFLFQEELFVAEEARLRGVRITYVPQLRAGHVRHVSIGRLSRDERRRHLHRSVSYILERYYSESGSVTRL